MSIIGISLTFFLFLHLTILISCDLKSQNSEEKSSEVSKSNYSKRIQVDIICRLKAKNEMVETDSFFIISKKRLEKIPIINFFPFFVKAEPGMIQDSAKISLKLFRELSLMKILDDSKKNMDVEIFAYRKINLSKRYSSYIFCVVPNESELEVYFINFNEEYQIIDYKLIGYDDITEGFVRITSRFDLN